MVELASFKIDAQSKSAHDFKSNTNELAVLEATVLKFAFGPMAVAEITVDEKAIAKVILAKMEFRARAAFKATIFIFAF